MPGTSTPPPAKKGRLKKSESDDDDEDGDKEISLTREEARVVKIQFEKDVVFDRWDDLMSEYCLFMKLKMMSPNIDFAPSTLIDKFWHAHILSTVQYLSFCERCNSGTFIHHDPTMKSGQKRYELTIEYYEKQFGAKPKDKDIWPAGVDDKPWSSQLQNQSASVKKVGTSVKKEEEEKEEEVEEEEEEEYESDNDNLDEGAREYLEEYGDLRGWTEEELKEWHKNAILDPKNNEGFDPREHPDVCNCGGGHRWFDGEFTLSCEECRISSEEIGGSGGFSCG